MNITPSLAAFYERQNDGSFVATSATQSPWDPRLQHGGPPTALLTHVIDERHPRSDMRIARVCAEFMGPMPIGTLTVHTQVRRPGRRIEMLEGSLECDGREISLARIWRIAVTGAGSVPEVSTGAELPPPLHSAGSGPQWLHGFGYGQAIEWRSVTAPDSLGPGDVWARPRLELIAGERTTQLAKTMLIADSANGISAELPTDAWLFVPPSLVVALERYPLGDWLFLRAKTSLSRDGIGVTTHQLGDETGFFATGLQPLLVERRPL